MSFYCGIDTIIMPISRNLLLVLPASEVMQFKLCVYISAMQL